MKYLLLAALTITSCGSEDLTDWHRIPRQKDPPPVKAEEPIQSLKQILDNFLYDCSIKHKANVSDVNKLEYIRYGDPATEENPTRIGVCWTWHYDNGALYKSNIIVKQMNTAISMRALMYHELGHCVLGLEHTDQESKTMMSPTMHNDAYYEANWDKLVKDMCQKYLK